MKSFFSTFVLIAVLVNSATATISQTFFDDVDSFLNRYVTEGKVNYLSIKNETNLSPLILQVENMDLSQATDVEKKAFYINAYNLSVINMVIEDYPITTVLPNGNDDFFDADKITVAGEEMTLNFLEKELLIKKDNDARIHFVVNCAAISCPVILNEAFRPELLEEQIVAQTRNAMNDTDFTRVNSSEEKVSLSKIFDWFESDFGGSTTKVLEFINEYRDENIPANYEVTHYEYNWDLNEFKGEPNGIKSLVKTEIVFELRDKTVSFLDANGTYELYDLQGKAILRGETKRLLVLDDLQGHYVIKVEVDGRLSSQRLFLK